MSNLSDHDLRDLAKHGLDILTQNVVLEKNTIVARVAIQYAAGCFTQEVVDRAVEAASIFLAQHLAESLNRDEANGGN